MSKQYRVRQDCWSLFHSIEFKQGDVVCETSERPFDACVHVRAINPKGGYVQGSVHKYFLEELPPTVEGPKEGDLFEVIRVTEGTRPLIGDRVAHHLIAHDSNYAFCKNPSTGTLERLKRDNLKPYTPPSEAPKFKPGDRVVTVRDARDCKHRDFQSVAAGALLTIEEGWACSEDESRLNCRDKARGPLHHLLRSDLALVETPKEEPAETPVTNAPAKFGVGDRVKYSGPSINSYGVYGYVHQIRDENKYGIQFDGCTFPAPLDYHESELTLISTAPTPDTSATPKFKVGDPVRVSRSGSIYEDQLGKVREAHANGNYSVQLNNKSFYVIFMETELLPAEQLPTVTAKEIRELLCQRCDCEYEVWFTQGEVWSKVTREGEHYLCPTCFTVLAKERAYNPRWLLTDDTANADMLSELKYRQSQEGICPAWLRVIVAAIYQAAGIASGGQCQVMNDEQAIKEADALIAQHLSTANKNEG